MERMRYLWGLYRKAFGAYTPQIALIVFLAFVSSAVEGLGISAIIPVTNLVSGGAKANDTISHIITGIFSLLHVPYSFRMLLVFMAILFVARTLLLFLIQTTSARIISNYERDLRRHLFSETLHARWPYLSQQKIGNLEQLITTNTSNASQFFGTISASAIVGTKVLIYLIVAINISWWIAVLALFAGLGMFFVLRPIFFRNRDVARTNEQTNRALAHFVGEHMIGMKAIKAMALEGPVLVRGQEFFEAMRALNIRSIYLRGYAQALVQIAGVAFVGLVFVIMYRSPGFTIGAFAVIVYAINQIFSLMQAGQTQLHGVTTLLPYVVETLRYGEESRQHKEGEGGGEVFRLQHGIEFKAVSFAYPGRGVVLSDASFLIKRGELLGVVGPSGAGKSTIADLLLRLIEPTVGTIAADDRDVRQVSLRQWRVHVGYVAQEAVLLNDTVRENITFYNPELSQKDIEHAAKLANIHAFIGNLPQGYDTVIGDRGVMLSGGERQRVALARVLARKPALLVLDEATSALDQESERAIQEAVEGLRGSITVVVIAHRLSTIRAADRILKVENGRIREAPREEIFNDTEL